MNEFNINPFTKFDKDWALVTSGTKEKFNSMTVSWGAMGTMWGKPVVTIYIRPERYTFEFLKNNEYFTVSFYDNKYKKQIGIMGNKSGRNINKVKLTGFSPKVLENAITYEEAKKTLICKKLYLDQMNINKFPKDVLKFYDAKMGVHYIIMGEVCGIA